MRAFIFMLMFMATSAVYAQNLTRYPVFITTPSVQILAKLFIIGGIKDKCDKFNPIAIRIMPFLEGPEESEIIKDIATAYRQTLSGFTDKDIADFSELARKIQPGVMLWYGSRVFVPNGVRTDTDRQWCRFVGPQIVNFALADLNKMTEEESTVYTDFVTGKNMYLQSTLKLNNALKRISGE